VKEGAPCNIRVLGSPSERGDWIARRVFNRLDLHRLVHLLLDESQKIDGFVRDKFPHVQHVQQINNVSLGTMP
jgi:hypothetical protein